MGVLITHENAHFAEMGLKQKGINEGYKGPNSLNNACIENMIYIFPKTKERNTTYDILAQKASIALH